MSTVSCGPRNPPWVRNVSAFEHVGELVVGNHGRDEHAFRHRQAVIGGDLSVIAFRDLHHRILLDLVEDIEQGPEMEAGAQQFGLRALLAGKSDDAAGR